MRDTVTLEGARLPPDRETILRLQGVPARHEVPERVLRLVTEGQALFQTLAEPRGVYASVPPGEFLELYRGEGQNAEPSPLPTIVRGADHLALFAATLGEAVSERIRALFAEGNPALGYMLDVIASERADAAANLLGQRFREALLRRGLAEPDTAVLPYSPGYCGWHVSGQRRLFARLEPEAIGITLNEGCLMTPIKSVSGVLVAAPPPVHVFDNDFEFCLDCATWECRNRIASLY